MLDISIGDQALTSIGGIVDFLLVDLLDVRVNRHALLVDSHLDREDGYSFKVRNLS